MMVWVDDGTLTLKNEENDQKERDELKGGGTEFPRLNIRGREDGQSICEIVQCDNSQGTTFKVKPGNAVYWENFRADGKGFDETWHAGLPVEKGVKVGLNIWSFGRIE